MRIIVVTGMSGSGKSTVLHALEDAGYYPVDNLPIPLLDKLIEAFSTSSGEIEKLALVADARASGLEHATPVLERIRNAGHQVDILFLDAQDDILERRYSETRRPHPLTEGDGSVRDGILRERALLDPLREAAMRVIDTSDLTVHDLRREALNLVADEGSKIPMGVTVLSFGFKRGLPHADLVLDVRFLPNPYFVPELKATTGEDPKCAAYVLDREETRAFLARVEQLLEFLIPQYAKEGKAYLTVALGCTGGQHRSVALAAELGRWLRERFPDRPVRVRHRDAPTPMGFSDRTWDPRTGPPPIIKP